MIKEQSKIGCPTFQKQESAIKEITDRINMAEGVREKAAASEELQRKADVLLSCPDYNENNTDCNNCRFIADVRKKTAALIIKARKLA